MTGSATVIRHGGFPRGASRLAVGEGAQLTALDRGIIRLLQQDGRISFVDLAARVGATEKTVRRRVAELRRSRFIEITTVADPALMGYRGMAMVGIEAAGEVGRGVMARELFEIPAVDYAVVTTGRFDLMVEVLCRDETDLLATIDDELRPRRGVRKAEVFPYLQLRYQQPIWDSAQARREIAGPPAEPPELDALDLVLVHELNEDGRIAFSRIAEHAAVSESLVRKRYARLTGSGLIRVLALTNPRSLGYRTTAWLAIRAAPGTAIGGVADRLSALPSIAYLAVVAGRCDIFAEVVCRDSRDLLELIDRELRAQPDIAGVETALCQDLYYRRVVPAA